MCTRPMHLFLNVFKFFFAEFFYLFDVKNNWIFVNICVYANTNQNVYEFEITSEYR